MLTTEKPGVVMKPAFDANYSEPGTFVISCLPGDKNKQFGLIMGYEEAGTVMKVNEPHLNGSCDVRGISVTDYLTGKSRLIRVVEEPSETYLRG